MKKNLTIIALGIAVALLLIWIIRDPKQRDSHQDDYAEIKTERDNLKVHVSESEKREDSLKLTVRQQDNIIKDLMAGQRQTRTELDKKAGEVKRMANEIREINQDTGVYGRKMDSLVEQVNNLSFLLVQYEQYTDSLNTANAKQQIDYEGIVKEADKTKAELQAAYDKLYKEYVALFDTAKGLMKDVKRERLKTKIAAILALVAGAAAVLK